MSKKYRLSLISISLIMLLAVGYAITGNFGFVVNDFWFTSGLLLLILLSLIDQPYFSNDSNIFVNAVTAGISLLLVGIENRDSVFWLFMSLTIYLLLSSYSLLWLRQKQLGLESKLIRFIVRINRQVGKPEALFSAFFIWGAFKQFGGNTKEFNALLLFWTIFLLINIPSIARSIEDLLTSLNEEKAKNALGQIFGVQSKNTFLIKLLNSNERKINPQLFDFVEFKYSSDKKVRKGLILENYLLDQEQWIKVLSNPDIENIFSGKEILKDHSLDIVYRIDEVPENNFLERFVGIVTDNSRINKIRFIYTSKEKIFEGQLLEITVQGSRVLYQIIEGIAKIEILENKNQTSIIVGEALQLGTWNETKFQFEQYGWVPDVNSPVFRASNIEEPRIEDNETKIGLIPDTNYPIILNKDLALSHHCAIIGVTGTGKSIFARSLVREFLKDKNVKVNCIDFTGEYIGKFQDLTPRDTIPKETAEKIFADIDFIEREKANNYNKDTDNSRARKKEVWDNIYSEIEGFLKGDEQLSIFELPHVENTSGILTYTMIFFRILFKIAKNENNFGKRICLILEEAHTVVPEWNFSGVSDKIAQPLLNSIAQIALQGRKYNVGLLVIAQRTANVSKTILTQCNTIVAFQEFDKTSSDFLANYFGQDIVQSLPKLKFRQAIAAGKAFRSSVPMIFEVPEINENCGNRGTQ